jgi:hypothetical protein
LGQKKIIANWNGVDAGKTMVSNGEFTMVKVDQKIKPY